MKLYGQDGDLLLDTEPETPGPSQWFAVLAGGVTLACCVGVFILGVSLGADAERQRAAAAVEPAGQAGADLDAACCPRWRPPQQADLDALTAAGGSLTVYVDEGGACATLWHNGQPIRGYAGHPLDAARGCLEAWIAEGGSR